MADEETKPKKKVEPIYDPDSFIIPAQDTKGHKERLQFYAQPGHVNQVAAIVASRKFPFRTRGGLMRWCLDIGLKRLEQIDESIPGVTSQVDAIIEVVKWEQFQLEMNQVLERLSGLASDLVAKGDTDEAKRVVLKIRRFISQMPEGYWRNRWVREIKERFAYILDRVEQASLLKLSTDEE